MNYPQSEVKNTLSDLYENEASASSPVIAHYDDMRPATGARWTVWVSLVGMGVLGVWAHYSMIDQVTRAPAQIIASARTQLVQAVDTGVLASMKVKEGDLVKAGQLLATFDRERAKASVGDSRGKVAALRITLARLHAEVFGKPLSFEKDLLPYAAYISNQRDLYERRKRAIEDDVSSLKSMKALAQQELSMNQALESSGDVSRTEVLRLQRTVADLEAQIANKRNKYFQDAQTEMTKAQEDLNTQRESLNDRSQSLQYTDFYAPMEGRVKNIKANTVGGVIRAGEILLEILPTGEDLIAEAKISPADIASVRVGQSASVKLDAYDYSIFGAMNGEVTYVSPDTLVEDGRNGPVSYYRVHIRIRDTEFKGQDAKEIQILPGMTASVDIKARERSVLSYLTKPIIKTLSQSMGER